MTPNYTQIQNALTAIESPYTPEDCHGMLCAMLVVNNSLQCKRWLDEIYTHASIANSVDTIESQTLCSLYDHTRKELNDTLLNFSLLIPEGENSLTARLEALKKWCDGFLFGIALAGIKDIVELPEDSSEILQDIASISQATGDDEEDDLSEVAYMDILEYVRMGVLLINEELQPMNSHVTIQ